MKYIIIILISLFCNIAFCQKKTPKLQVFLSECINKGINYNAYDITSKNFAHIYSITLSFDKDGKIDSLYYSDKINQSTKQLFNLNDALLKKIKSYNFTFEVYAYKMVVVIFYNYRADDNYVDYKFGFLNDIKNLLPNIVYGKPIIILEPVINAQLPRVAN